jgi:WS/DGAT/MGAT family acyltransferase
MNLLRRSAESDRDSHLHLLLYASAPSWNSGPMRQLSGTDATFLAIETPTTTGHVGGLSIIDPSTATEPLTLERLTALFAERLPLIPVLHRRLHTVPLGLDQPYWVDDPDFDIEFHLRELALPAPGDDRQLGEQVARLHARPLDRARPLWEAYLISGLAGGRMALYTKVHHAAVDGVGGAELMTQLFDLSPDGRELPSTPAEAPVEPPGTATMLWRGVTSVAGNPVRTVRLLGGLLRSVPSAASLAAPAVRQVFGAGERDGGVFGIAGSAPPTPFNRPITPHRRFAFRTLGLTEFKEIKNAFGVTINDVFVAVSAGAIRRWLIDHDALPNAPLTALMPISLKVKSDGKSPADGGVSGNQVSAMIAQVPTHLGDPGERISMASEATKAAKARHAVLPEGLVDDVTGFFAPALAARAARVAFGMGLISRTRPFNVVMSNVPGSSVPVYLGGAKLVAMYPLSVIGDGLGLNVTVLSYHGGVHFGLLACRELIPDLDVMAEYLLTELAELLELARARSQSKAALSTE